MVRKEHPSQAEACVNSILVTRSAVRFLSWALKQVPSYQVCAPQHKAIMDIYQCCAGKLAPEKNVPLFFIVFAIFCGANTPTTSDFKLPTDVTKQRVENDVHMMCIIDSCEPVPASFSMLYIDILGAKSQLRNPLPQTPNFLKEKMSLRVGAIYLSQAEQEWLSWE